MSKNKDYLSKISKKYKISWIHNPKHFFLNSLYIETMPDGRKVLCGTPRPHNKHFTKLAILKPIIKNKSVIVEQKVKLPFTDGVLLNQ